MINDTSAQNLHDQATRGGELTEAERVWLEAWYAQKDQEEAALLGASASSSHTAINNMRDEFALAIKRLREKSEQLEAQATENDVLRREVDALSESSRG